jgi:iron complex transport system permease protein
LAVAISSPPATDPGRAERSAARRTRLGWLLSALVVLVVIAMLSVALGARSIPFGDVWRLLWSDDGSPDALIVHQYRIPRTLLGVLTGIALGLSGALMQALTRNPLADPGLLGVSLGASSGVVVAIVFLGVGSVLGYLWLAFAGAALAMAAVYLLGTSGRGALAPERLVLAGAALAAVLYAANTAILMIFPRAFDNFRFWTVGSLAGRGYPVVWTVLPFIAAGTVLALALAGPLNALALGERTGRALGVSVRRTQVLTVLAVAVLCGAATAAAGPIWFVGLAVPHIARLAAGPDLRWLLAFSLVLAPILLLGADVLGRVLGAPGELQVGIVTAFLGAPVFIALCRRRKLAEL